VRRLLWVVGACLLWLGVAAAQDRTRIITGETIPANCVAGDLFAMTAPPKGLHWCDATNTWINLNTVAGGGSSVPAGAIVFVDSGSCPSGYAEVSTAAGRMILATVAANADVGTTGGSDTVTPAGTVGAPTLTMDPITQVINHTHSGTATIPVGATDDTAAPFDRADAGTNASGANATTTGTVTVNNPTGGVASITPTGSVSAPTFTGTALDNRSAFIRLIACKKA